MLSILLLIILCINITFTYTNYTLLLELQNRQNKV